MREGGSLSLPIIQSMFTQPAVLTTVSLFMTSVSSAESETHFLLKKCVETGAEPGPKLPILFLPIKRQQ